MISKELQQIKMFENPFNKFDPVEYKLTQAYKNMGVSRVVFYSGSFYSGMVFYNNKGEKCLAPIEATNYVLRFRANQRGIKRAGKLIEVPNVPTLNWLSV